MGVSKKLEDAFSSGEKQPETPESTVSCGKGKGHLDLDTPEAFSDKTSYRETVLFSRENERESNTPKVTLLHSVDAAKYEVPAPTEYLRDGQRYAEPDDSLYLGKEECLEPVGYSEHAETILGEEDYNDPEDIVYDGEEDFVNSQTTDFSEKKESCEDEETGMSLEEEEEKGMEGMDMRCDLCPVGQQLFLGCHDMGRGEEEGHLISPEKHLLRNLLWPGIASEVGADRKEEPGLGKWWAL